MVVWRSIDGPSTSFWHKLGELNAEISKGVKLFGIDPVVAENEASFGSKIQTLIYLDSERILQKFYKLFRLQNKGDFFKGRYLDDQKSELTSIFFRGIVQVPENAIFAVFWM